MRMYKRQRKYKSGYIDFKIVRDSWRKIVLYIIGAIFLETDRGTQQICTQFFSYFKNSSNYYFFFELLMLLCCSLTYVLRSSPEISLTIGRPLSLAPHGCHVWPRSTCRANPISPDYPCVAIILCSSRPTLSSSTRGWRRPVNTSPLHSYVCLLGLADLPLWSLILSRRAQLIRTQMLW